MHGQRRTAYKARFQDPQVAKGLAQKAQQWHALNQTSLQQRLTGILKEAEAAVQSNSSDDHSKALLLLDKMLRVNPDPMHLWNHRRELLGLLHAFDSIAADVSTSDSRTYLSTELALTAAALERNPKAYGAWFHRKWCLQQSLLQLQKSVQQSVLGAFSSSQATLLLDKEVALTEQFLMQDERNFHCWNYRRFLVGVQLELATSGNNSATGLALDGSWPFTPEETDATGTGRAGSRMMLGPQITPCTSAAVSATSSSSESTPPCHHSLGLSTAEYSILQREWTFSKTKIVQNFSNGSAFHYRSKLLLSVALRGDENNNYNSCWCLEGDETRAPSSSDGLLPTLATQEWKLMENIMFTEPDDQTIWWYHRFVLDWVHQKQREHQRRNTSDNWYSAWLHQQAETLEMLLEDEPHCKWAWLGYHWVLTRQLQQSQPAGVGTDKELQNKVHTVLDRLLILDPDRERRYLAMKYKPMKSTF